MLSFTPGFQTRTRLGQAAPPAAPAPAPAAAPAAPAAAPSSASGITIPAGMPWYQSIWYQPAVLGIPLAPVALGVAGVFAVTALLAAKKNNGR